MPQRPNLHTVPMYLTLPASRLSVQQAVPTPLLPDAVGAARQRLTCAAMSVPAPAANSTSTTSMWPLPAVWYSGVSPF